MKFLEIVANTLFTLGVIVMAFLVVWGLSIVIERVLP